jgi:hypothetical protein
MSLLRNPLAHLLTTLTAIGGSTYLLRSHHIHSLEEHEARMDELEGTLRGHIGLIEEALDRLEGTASEADRGKKMYASMRSKLDPQDGADIHVGTSIMASVVGTRSRRSSSSTIDQMNHSVNQSCFVVLRPLSNE